MHEFKQQRVKAQSHEKLP